MGIGWTLARASFFGRPSRTLFSMLGIGLGIAIGVGVVTLDTTTIHGLSPRDLATVPDLQVRPARGREQPASDLAATEGVAAAAGFFQNDAFVRAAPRVGVVPAEETQRVRLYGLDSPAAPALDAYVLLEGRDLDPSREHREVLVGEALARALGIGLGDPLSIARPRRAAKTECVDGQIVSVGPARTEVPLEETFQVVGILGREGLGHHSRGMVVIIDFEWGKGLYEGVHIDTSFWVKRDPTVNIERLRASLSLGYSYELNEAALLGQAADERAFRSGVRMAGLLAMLLGLYVIFHTLSMSLVERLGEVGTLRALGVTRAQLARIFLLEAVALAGGGAILGQLGGIAIARGLLAVGITTLGSGKHVAGFEVPWTITLALTGLGFVIALVGSVYPLLLLHGSSTVAALRGEEALQKSGVRRGFHLFAAILLVVVLPSIYLVLVPVVGEFSGELVSIVLSAVGLLAAVVTLSFLVPIVLSALCGILTIPLSRAWPLAGRLAARSMRQSPTRIAVSASAIALVGASFIGLKGLTDSLRGEVEVWAGEAAVDKVFVRNLPEVPFATLAERLHQFPGVLAVERGSARAHSLFLLLGMDASELARSGPLHDDPRLVSEFESGHGVILSRRLAAAYHHAVGDPLHVTKADGSVQEFRVLAVSDAYGFFPAPDERDYAVVAVDYLHRYFCVDSETVTDVSVRLEPGTDPELVATAVHELLPDARDLRFDLGAQVRDFHLADIDRDFVLFDILIVLTALLAGLGVLNGQLLAALERAKEIGILKALGTSGRQVAGMVLLEALVVGLVGGALAALLGTLATPLVVHSVQTLAGLTLPMRDLRTWCLLALAGGLAVSLVAALYPIRRLNRFDAVRAVRTS